MAYVKKIKSVIDSVSHILYEIKNILEPNQRVKLANGRVYAVTLVTSTKMRNANEFRMKKYKKIK